MVVLRPKGWEAQGDEGQEALRSWCRVGYVYRGMTSDEYMATVGVGKSVQSSGRYSHPSEGTNYAPDPGTAEDYANFGRDDPRKTGKTTYLVEVKKTKDMRVERDGYTKTASPHPATRVWKMYAKDGAVVAEPVQLSRNFSRNRASTHFDKAKQDLALSRKYAKEDRDGLAVKLAHSSARHAQNALDCPGLTALQYDCMDEVFFQAKSIVQELGPARNPRSRTKAKKQMTTNKQWKRFQPKGAAAFDKLELEYGYLMVQKGDAGYSWDVAWNIPGGESLEVSNANFGTKESKQDARAAAKARYDAVVARRAKKQMPKRNNKWSLVQAIEVVDTLNGHRVIQHIRADDKASSRFSQMTKKYPYHQYAVHGLGADGEVLVYKQGAEAPIRWLSRNPSSKRNSKGLSLLIGEEKYFESPQKGGARLRVKKHSRGTYFLRIEGTREHARWGNASQAREDIAYFLETGALPRSSERNPKRNAGVRNPMMTKKQFTEYFKHKVMPLIPSDRTSRRTTWNDLIDGLIKDGQLPDRAGDWIIPSHLEKKRSVSRNKAPMTKAQLSQALEVCRAQCAARSVSPVHAAARQQKRGSKLRAGTFPRGSTTGAPKMAKKVEMTAQIADDIAFMVSGGMRVSEAEDLTGVARGSFNKFKRRKHVKGKKATKKKATKKKATKKATKKKATKKKATKKKATKKKATKKKATKKKATKKKATKKKATKKKATKKKTAKRAPKRTAKKKTSKRKVAKKAPKTKTVFKGTIELREQVRNWNNLKVPL